MAKVLKATRPEPPKQACRYCGQLMDLTEDSRARYFETEALKGVMARGLFYRCPCTPVELQFRDERAWTLHMHGAKA